MDTKPFVSLFKTYGAYYIYDVNKNAIIKTEKRVWDILKESKCNSEQLSSENAYEYSVIKRLKDGGFLSSNKVKQIKHPTNDIIEDYINNRIEMITLQLTQQCNFRCEYCAYSGAYENREHGNKRMTFEMAKKGIDFLVDHSSSRHEVFVGLYGGEPLIEFDLIKKIIEYCKEDVFGKKISFTITTNGTLLNETMIDFLYKNDVRLTISLDGPKDIHDKNRKFTLNSCGTFDTVMEKINLIKRDFPDYIKKIAFNAVIDPKNDVSCVHKFFNDYETVNEAIITYSDIAENYSKKPGDLDEKHSVKMEYEYFKFLLSKLNKLEEKHTSKLLKRRFSDLEDTYKYLKITESLPDNTHHAGPCIPGAQRLFLNAYGDFFPCERVSETSEVVKIGDIEHGLNIDKVLEILNIGKLSEENCKNCWAIRFCCICVGMVDDGYEMSRELKTSKCFGSKNRALTKLMDICVLTEFGYKFQKI